MLIVNVILLWVMYADFVLWFSRGQAYNVVLCVWQMLPLIFIVLAFIVYLVIRKIQERKIVFQFKVQLVEKIISPSKETSVFYRIGRIMTDAFGSKSTNPSEEFLKSIKTKKLLQTKIIKKSLSN
mgnify:CR=1 FL=1